MCRPYIVTKGILPIKIQEPIFFIKTNDQKIDLLKISSSIQWYHAHGFYVWFRVITIYFRGHVFLIELPRYHIITIFRIMNFTLYIFSVKLCDLSGNSH